MSKGGVGFSGGGLICCVGLGLLCLLTVFQYPAASQVATAHINGVVRDTSDAVIPQAELVLGNVETGVERRAVSNEAGNYVFLNLPPGPYTLQASKEGFRTSIIEPFVLAVNQTATFDFSLEVGAVTESITVTAAGAQLQSSTAELGTVIEQRRVLDLPLNGRNFTQLLLLTPGASSANVSQNSGGGQVTAIGEFTYPAINGQHNRANLFLLDGINNQGNFFDSYAVPPIIDAIQEFKVQSHNDLAEFGTVAGGIVNVVSKSGTNEYHGTGWWFHRNDNFDARNFFRKDVTPLVQNMYGGTMGGPIVRNKTFFFAGYQGFRNRTPADRLYRVPTAANLQGDLSDWPDQIFNPFSTRENPDKPGTFTRDPFPNNQIPQSLIQEGYVEYARQTLPAPIATGIRDRNQLDLTPTEIDQEEYTARVDHYFSERNQVWARVAGQFNRQTNSGGRQTLLNFTDIDSINPGASWVHTFSPTSILQVQFGRTKVERAAGQRFLGISENFPVQTVGFDPDFCCSFKSGDILTPGLNVGGFFGGGEIVRSSVPTDVWQYKASYSVIRGNHHIKFGGEYNYTTFSNILHDHSVVFAASETSEPANPGTTGSPLASFLLDVPNSASRREFFKFTRPGGVAGVFIQDSWKATPKLTVNIGLRYDRTFIANIGQEKHGTQFYGNIDMVRGIYELADVPGTCADLSRPPCLPDPTGALPDRVVVDPLGNGSILRDPTDNWAPRLGFAYRLTDRTTIRTSFGLFYDNWAGHVQGSQGLGHTWPDVGRQRATRLNTITPRQPLPSVPGLSPFPAVTTPTPTPFTQGAVYWNPFYKNTLSAQWNFGIQRQIGDRAVMNINYVGSGNSRVFHAFPANVATTPGPGDPKERRPFPFINPSKYQTTWSRANYHSLQTQMKFANRSGLTYLINYTWSKAIDIGCSGFSYAGCSVQNPYDMLADRSVSGFDLTHIFNISAVYDIPVGPGRRFNPSNKVLGHIIGNWQLNTIASFQSGQPHIVSISGDIGNTGNRNGFFRPDAVGDPEISNPTVSRWFNTSAFAKPAPFSFGTAGRNPLRADGLANFDISLFRDIVLPGREGMRLQLRVEAFNAFNSPQFAAPVANFSDTRNFGRVTRTGNTERQIQVGMKFIF